MILMSSRWHHGFVPFVLPLSVGFARFSQKPVRLSKLIDRDKSISARSLKLVCATEDYQGNANRPHSTW